MALECRGLIDEFSALKQRNFVLDFVIPTMLCSASCALSIVICLHKSGSVLREKKEPAFANLLDDLESGELHRKTLMRRPAKAPKAPWGKE